MVKKENYDKFIFKGSLALESYVDDMHENLDMFNEFNEAIKKYRSKKCKSNNDKEKKNEDKNTKKEKEKEKKNKKNIVEEEEEEESEGNGPGNLRETHNENNGDFENHDNFENNGIGEEHEDEYNEQAIENKNTKYADYPEKMLELINRIRENPSYYADVVEDSIKNIIEVQEEDEDQIKPKIIYKKKVKIVYLILKLNSSLVFLFLRELKDIT